MDFSLTDDLEDLDLKNLLEDWNLGHLYEHFLEQKVTLNILGILKNHHVEKLFQNLAIGDLALFEHKWELWKQTRLYNFKSPTVESIKPKTRSGNKEILKDKPLTSKTHPEESDFRTTAVIVPQISVAPTVQVSTTPRKSLEQIKQASSQNSLITGSSNVKSTNSSSSNIMPTLAAPLPRHSMVPVRYNLRSILEETNGGQMIMQYYEKNKILREEHRTALISVIARYIDTNGGVFSLAESNQMEQQIVEIFPTEKAEFYRTNRRGRIYNKVANMKRVYRKFNMTDERSMDNSSTSAPSSPVNIIKEEDSEFYDDFVLNDFRNKSHGPEKYLKFWKNTQKMRLKSIEDIESLGLILEKWPEYKQHNAVEFINMDFKAKYPNSTSFMKVFLENKAKLERLLYGKTAVCSAGYKYLQLYKNCNSESQNLIILWVMHQLFPPSQKLVVDEMGVKRKKRFTIQCSQNAFVCIRSTLESLETALETSFSSATPPMILIVGELAGDIDQIFVYFEGVRFPMDSVVTAAQLVCELFFLFDLDYPEEATLFYYFVQSYFLNIESEMKNTKIYTIINEINAC